MRVPANQLILETCGHRRRGALFTMIQVQILISSVLMGIGGICLHTALRSSQLDQHSLIMLRSLTRLERQLRVDEGVSTGLQVVSATELRISGAAADGGAVIWRTTEKSVERIEGDLSSPSASEIYIFPAGTGVEFTTASTAVLVRIHESAPGVKSAGVRRLIELQLRAGGGGV
jgi:hypothetical protein